MAVAQDDDPLTLAMAPPPDETPVERAERERKEHEALQRSRQIDAELKNAKAALKRQKRAIRVLVLGQSMSGKSTTIKNFQLAYATKAWSEERAAWKAVILLNLVRSVNLMVDTLESIDVEPPAAVVEGQQSSKPVNSLTERHRNVFIRLAPLRQIEKDLRTLLGAGASEVEVKMTIGDGQTHIELSKGTLQEFCVRSSSGWKSVLNQIGSVQQGKSHDLHRIAQHVISECREDIRWLWNDPQTKSVLSFRNVRLEDSPGFFLDDIDRITAPEYAPSDQDIVRARLRTTGVQEHHFKLDRANATALDWIIYDVAGIRTSRAAWVPYFKDITALIFLAPLSAFNERLAEDTRVNCLEDTFMLWRNICGNRLLENVQIILFMNKTDLLRKKLQQGIRVKKYIPEYDKANDYETVSTWFRRVFKRIYLDTAPAGHTFVSHFTSVVDTQATAHTLQAVQATILRNDIADAGLM